MRWLGAWVSRLAMVACGGLTLAGCGQSTSDFDSESVVVASCQAPTDQRQSFMAKVPGFPLKLSADAAFTGPERAGIESAVRQWNALGQSLIGQPFYELRFAALASSVHDSDPRDCSVRSFGSADSFSIVRESSGPRWQGLGFNDSIPAATLRCFSGRHVNHQVVLVNVNLIDPAQVASVALHELGHAIGLDHSCMDGAGKAQFRSCAGLAETHPYHQAVMFPTLRSRRTPFELPEIKEQLTGNDVTRARCLYDGNSN